MADNTSLLVQLVGVADSIELSDSNEGSSCTIDYSNPDSMYKSKATHVSARVDGQLIHLVPLSTLLEGPTQTAPEIYRRVSHVQITGSLVLGAGVHTIEYGLNHGSCYDGSRPSNNNGSTALENVRMSVLSAGSLPG